MNRPISAYAEVNASKLIKLISIAHLNMYLFFKQLSQEADASVWWKYKLIQNTHRIEPLTSSESNDSHHEKYLFVTPLLASVG